MQPESASKCATCRRKLDKLYLGFFAFHIVVMLGMLLSFLKMEIFISGFFTFDARSGCEVVSKSASCPASCSVSPFRGKQFVFSAG